MLRSDYDETSSATQRFSRLGVNRESSVESLGLLDLSFWLPCMGEFASCIIHSRTFLIRSLLTHIGKDKKLSYCFYTKYQNLNDKREYIEFYNWLPITGLYQIEESLIR